MILENCIYNRVECKTEKESNQDRERKRDVFHGGEHGRYKNVRTKDLYPNENKPKTR